MNIVQQLHNMLVEEKILFNNIKNLRHLITEDVGGNNIVNAIQNHEYLYIYYSGDDNNKMGYRTIRPYVLGTSKAGNKVLRAWQDNPKNSYSFDNKPTRPDSQNHDYWTDEQGMKPGWRMFRVDKISKAYPTGKKFHDSNNLVMIPTGYHEGGDDDMTSIDAYVSTKKDAGLDYKYDKEFRGQQQTKADAGKQKWDSIRRGNKNNRKITAADVTKLRDIASNVYKENRGNFLVAIDDKNNFQLIRIKDKDKQNIPDSAIVGNLPNLYNTLVQKNAPVNDKFFKDQLNTVKSGVTNTTTEIKETNLPSIPFEKKTFFKQ
jgi:hypothetical protein